MHCCPCWLHRTPHRRPVTLSIYTRIIDVRKYCSVENMIHNHKQNGIKMYTTLIEEFKRSWLTSLIGIALFVSGIWLLTWNEVSMCFMVISFGYTTICKDINLKSMPLCLLLVGQSRSSSAFFGRSLQQCYSFKSF